MRFKKEADKLYSKLIVEHDDEGVKCFKPRRVYPIFDQEGKIIWKNFLVGNWKGLLISLLIVLVTIGLILEYISNAKVGTDCLAREAARNITNYFP